MTRLLPSLLALCLLGGPAAAQLDDLQPTNAPYFAPIGEWPTPTTVRSATGAPGPDYWQQRADYRISFVLDPDSRSLSAEQTITYTNNSPDALPFLWLHLEQNLFASESRGAVLTPPDARWRGAFLEGGYTLDRVEVIQQGRRSAPAHIIDDTRMRIDLPEPLAPGQRMDIDLAWRFIIPEFGADRLGILDVDGGTIYQLAQAFPRMAVFDDVRGWNPLPYLGQGEFYLNYGDFEVHVTVPSEFVVVATGEQTNMDATWPADQLMRFRAARQSADTVPIVRPEEAGRRPAGGSVTWTFRAENVRDFAWAASDVFVVDGAGYTTPAGDEVLILSAYPPSSISQDPSEPGWEEATRYSRFSIQYHSERWFPYPYPVAISVAGVVGGMEYPMIQFSGHDRRHFSLFGVIDHELGHQWFPMIVGSDERRHFWMDEGLTYFLTQLSAREFYERVVSPEHPGHGRSDEVAVIRFTRPEYIADVMQRPHVADLPIVTPSDHIRTAGLGFVAYFKPGAAFRVLREQVLGEDRFDAALNAYIERWAFKHPQPADLFRTIEDVSGEDLAWFWRGWFYTTDTIDQSVEAIERVPGGSVVVVGQEGAFMPIDLEVEFEDGSAERLRVPVEAFIHENRFGVRLQDPRRVVAATVDPDMVLPDVDRGNNTFRVHER